MMRSLVLWSLTSGLVLVLAGFCSAAEVKVENYSNDNVYVAQADNKGQMVSNGWTVIESNGVSTFKAADSADLYLRVEDKNGNEITFSNHTKFLNFPTHAQRFLVKSEPDDAKVWVLKYGQDLDQSQNIKKTTSSRKGGLVNGTSRSASAATNWRSSRNCELG